MKKQKSKHPSICFLLPIWTTVLAVNVAGADEFTQTGTFNSKGPVPYEVTPFDSSLGSLRNVYIEISGVLNPKIGLILDDKNYNVGLGLNFSRPPDVLPFFKFEDDGVVFTYQGKSPKNPVPEFFVVFPFAPLELPAADLNMKFSFSREREAQGLFGGVLSDFSVNFQSDTLPGYNNIPVSHSASPPSGIIGGTINYNDLLLLPNDLFPVVTEVFGKTAGPARGDFAGTITIVYDYIPAAVEPPDFDGDGVPNLEDNCPVTANPDQTDNDQDGLGDACEGDDDNDGVPNVSDNCPLVVNPNQIDEDENGVGDACESDDDGDGRPNNIDNCPSAANPDQTDSDGDSLGDECDTDDDNDNLPDDLDNCPSIPNQPQGDLDGDGIGDICDADLDGDGIDNVADNCPIDVNAGQDDTDSDGMGDLCDADDDDDGLEDTGDNCSLIFNPDQADLDRDGRGDVCDDDLDGDGVDNGVDNCANTANSGQADFDGDALGDVCDPDIDGDEVVNGEDYCAATPIGDLVHPNNGCSIAQLCPCNGPRGTILPWRNHGKYVSCHAQVTETFLIDGIISESEKDVIMAMAGESACGEK